MSQALLSAGPLKADIRLAQALSEFEASLPPGDKARLRSAKFQSQTKPPTLDDVMRFTADVDAQARRSLGSGRCFGPRLTYMLQTVQQFAALGDILVGGSQNLIACGVWSVVRMSIMAATISASTMDKISLLFMTAGRSAPRYRELSLLYARSRQIRDYLAEYTIVIVQICHYFHDFCQKSAIRQITSTWSDNKIRNWEEELTRWAQLIKDEASFVLAQTTESEAVENSRVRKWLTRSIDSSTHQRRVDKKIQWLTAFSTFDYETPWKQARKRGSSTFFANVPSYKQWKGKQGPPNLLLSGKMGCGKSVIMANMVDDLHLSCPQDTIIYFFCRHDVPESLKARTIFGSMAAQISQRYVETDIMDEILTNSVPFMSLDRLLEILPKLMKKIAGVRLILDGIDECAIEEIELIRRSLSQLRTECDLMSCVSYRDQADGLQAKVLKTEQTAMIPVPNDNPDICEFIEEELQRLLAFGKLSIGDPELLVAIREALLQGADGMFLWVALQIDTLCAEKTDNSIRLALENLPRTLGATFRRILQNAKQEGRDFQKDILKTIVGANRPLVLAEFREALSVTPGDILWDTGKLINNIHSALACCGSLVMIDEEEETVRLLHQSVAQFLHITTVESAEWSFSAHDANTHLGDITVTYLNYGVFDQRVSTRVVPKIYAGGVPDKIVNQASRSFGSIVRKLANTALKPKGSSERDIGATISAAINTHQNSRRTSDDFDFLAYSSQNWLFHTSHMADSCPMLDHINRLLDHPVFGKVALAEEERLVVNLVMQGSQTVLQVPPRLEWAILHSHSLLFLAELRGKSWIKALVSVSPYLDSLMNSKKSPRLSPRMIDQLLLITTLFRAVRPTDWLIRMSGYSCQEYLDVLKPNQKSYDTVIWAAARNPFTSLHDVLYPLVEQAFAHNDGRTVRSLLKKGARTDIYTHESPLHTAMWSSFYHPEDLLLVMRILQTAKTTDVVSLPPFDMFTFFNSLAFHCNLKAAVRRNFDQVFKFDDTPKSTGLKVTILQLACESGKPDVVKLLLPHTTISHHQRSDLMLKALSAGSPSRASIVRLLVTSSGGNLSHDHYGHVLRYAMQLRVWPSAFSIARALVSHSRSFLFTDPFSLHDCVDLRDINGLDFLLHHTSPGSSHERSMEMMANDTAVESFSVQDSPLVYALVSDWGSTKDCCELLGVAAYLQNLQKTLNSAGPTGDQIKKNWALEDDNGLALDLCGRVLDRYLITSQTTTFSNHSLSQILHNIGSPDGMAEVISEIKRVMIALFAFMRGILEDLSGASPATSAWCEAITMVLKSYSSIVTLIHRIHTTDGLDFQQKEGLVDGLNCLKMNVVVIAEALLEKCITADCGDNMPDQDIYDCLRYRFATQMEGWQVHGIMGWLLQAYGVGDMVEIKLEDPIQEFYAPLRIEGLVLGDNFDNLLQVIGETGLMHQIRAAKVAYELDIPLSSSARDVPLMESIEKWRDQTRHEGFTLKELIALSEETSDGPKYFFSYKT